MDVGVNSSFCMSSIAVFLLLLVVSDYQVVVLVNGEKIGEPSSPSSLSCDFFKGRWILDQSYPLYNPSSCPFIEHEFTCQKNGRPDQIYTKYRWQPHDCDLARCTPSSLSLSLASLLLLIIINAFLLLRLLAANIIAYYFLSCWLGSSYISPA